MKKRFLAVLAVLGSCAGLFAQEAEAVAASSTGAAKYIAAAIAVGSENPELSGKALPFVGLAEGICLWGMLVAVLILFM